ncbi:hypothetical protein FOA52_001552 [Chlamydomonas sp. UWO 241]|nr:hypothetical protein FOA52_001552 [Chlamydomonas sp. UWO 241]
MAPSTSITDLGPIEELRAALWGEMVLPGETNWEQAVKVWCYPAQGKARTPAVVVRPRGTSDVVTAVKYATKHRIPFAVKGGGHTPANLGIANGGMTLDMSLMRSVFVDPVAKVAVVDGGALLGDVDMETALYNLCVPLGHAPVTGMGLALGGGVGVATRLFGPTCDHIIGVTLVTADGTVHDVSADGPDAELLWGLRGAGAAFGVATKIRFRLNDVTGHCGGVMTWRDEPGHETFKAVARFMRDVGYHTPGFSTNLNRITPDGGPPVLVSQMVLLGEPGREEETMKILEPLRALGPITDSVRPGGYIDCQFAHAKTLARSPPHYEIWTAGTLPLDACTDNFIDALAEQLCERHPDDKCPLSLGGCDIWGGKLCSTDAPVAFAASKCEFSWLHITSWIDPTHSDDAVAYNRATRAELGRAAAARMVVEPYGNFGSTEEHMEDEVLIKRAGGADNLARLRVLKAKYDPTNLFASHHFVGLERKSS